MVRDQQLRRHGIRGSVFAVYYRRLGLQTVAELFAVRFGSRRCQWLTSFCVQTEYAIINVIEAYVIGVILSSLAPLTMLQGVLIAAASRPLAHSSLILMRILLF